jgi:hypothetical protein
MCTTCQSCSCDNVTLPISTGPTGATGATGAAGADGADGVAVLHNDTAQSTTSSASIALFSATKAYSLPANTLSTNGSKLILTATFTTTGAGVSGTSNAYVYLAGSSFTAKTVPYQVFHGNTDYQYYMKIRLEITRESTTNLVIVSDSYICDETGSTLASYHFTEDETVADLSANALAIDLRGKTNGDITTFNCEQLTVDHLIKA